jgi:glucose-6-phosphate dehydrogenase assembly protein OpcA
VADAVDASTTLGSWQADDTTIGRVLAAIDDLRRDVPARTGTRTAVLTLVAIAADPAECARSVEAVHQLGATHPARTVGIVAADGARPLRARVTLHGVTQAGRTLWSEDIELGVGGPAARHLDSLIEPFTLPDLPVVVWFVDEIPEVSDHLLDAADAVIVDARDLADVESFAAIRAMADRRPVIDLSWIRLRPWRELLASLFEGDCRRFVRGVVAAEVRGKPGPRRLLAGWLAGRLDLPRRAFQLHAAEHAYVRLVTEAAGRRAEFTVSRRGDERALVATTAVDPNPPHHSLRLLPEAGIAWGLQEALTSLSGDPLYLEAISTEFR